MPNERNPDDHTRPDPNKPSQNPNQKPNRPATDRPEEEYDDQEGKYSA